MVNSHPSGSPYRGVSDEMESNFLLEFYHQFFEDDMPISIGEGDNNLPSTDIDGLSSTESFPPALSCHTLDDSSCRICQELGLSLQDAQQRLIYCYHALRCEDSNSQPPRPCRVSPKCQDIVKLLQHVTTCTDRSASCWWPECGSTFHLMEHNRMCVGTYASACMLCQPLNETMNRKRSRLSVIVNKRSPRVQTSQSLQSRSSELSTALASTSTDSLPSPHALPSPSSRAIDVPLPVQQDMPPPPPPFQPASVANHTSDSQQVPLGYPYPPVIDAYGNYQYYPNQQHHPHYPPSYPYPHGPQHSYPPSNYSSLPPPQPPSQPQQQPFVQIPSHPSHQRYLYVPPSAHIVPSQETVALASSYPPITPRMNESDRLNHNYSNQTPANHVQQPFYNHFHY